VAVSIPPPTVFVVAVMNLSGFLIPEPIYFCSSLIVSRDIFLFIGMPVTLIAFLLAGYQA